MGWVSPITRITGTPKACGRCGGRIGVAGEIVGWVGKLCNCPPQPPKTAEQRIADFEERVARLERGPTLY